MAKTLNINKGFTLIEVLVAITVIAVGIFAMMNVVMVTISGNAESKNYTVATNLAQQKMENILNFDYGTITTSNPEIGTYTTFTDYRYTHSLMVTIDEDNPIANAKMITVNTYWNPATVTSTHAIELQSIISK